MAALAGAGCARRRRHARPRGDAPAGRRRRPCRCGPPRPGITLLVGADLPVDIHHRLLRHRQDAGAGGRAPRPVTHRAQPQRQRRGAAGRSREEGGGGQGRAEGVEEGGGGGDQGRHAAAGPATRSRGSTTLRRAPVLRQRRHHRAPRRPDRGEAARHAHDRRRARRALRQHGAILQRRLRPRVLARSLERGALQRRAPRPSTRLAPPPARLHDGRLPARQAGAVVRPRRRRHVRPPPVRLAGRAALPAAHRRGRRGGPRPAGGADAPHRPAGRRGHRDRAAVHPPGPCRQGSLRDVSPLHPHRQEGAGRPGAGVVVEGAGTGPPPRRHARLPRLDHAEHQAHHEEGVGAAHGDRQARRGAHDHRVQLHRGRDAPLAEPTSGRTPGPRSVRSVSPTGTGTLAGYCGGYAPTGAPRCRGRRCGSKLSARGWTPTPPRTCSTTW